jgi:hypothetical protein
MTIALRAIDRAGSSPWPCTREVRPAVPEELGILTRAGMKISSRRRLITARPKRAVTRGTRARIDTHAGDVV